jgi:hypothetical protein
VEEIGTYSNKGSLREKRAELRKRIQESPRRPSRTHHGDPTPRSKRFLNADDLTEIALSYEAATTNAIASSHGISKTKVATVLREQGITLRRQGLTDEQVTQAATLYAVGRSLAWLGMRYDVSHTTIAAVLRSQGMTLRPRPGWQ